MSSPKNHKPNMEKAVDTMTKRIKEASEKNGKPLTAEQAKKIAVDSAHRVDRSEGR